MRRLYVWVDWLIYDAMVIASMVYVAENGHINQHPNQRGRHRVDKKSKKLSVVTLPNQDPLEATTGLVPLVGIDVWVRCCCCCRAVRVGFICCGPMSALGVCVCVGAFRLVTD